MAEYENTITMQQTDRTQLQRMAWLIDCDNTSWRLIPRALAVAAAEGNLLIRRAYGDWSDISLRGWRETCIKHAITQIQVTTYSPGKNSTDLLLTIDAMELCLTGRVEAVCIVSGDSDFAPLAQRLRGHGIHVLGIGAGADVSDGFAQACDRFQRIRHVTPEPPGAREELGPDSGEAGEQHWTSLLREACRNSRYEGGWAHLGWAGLYIRRLRPGFDVKSYGVQGLRDLVATREDLFEIEDRLPNPAGPPDPWIRIRVPEGNRPSREPLRSQPSSADASPSPPNTASNEPATPIVVQRQSWQGAITEAPPVLPSESPGSWERLVAEALQLAPKGEDGWIQLPQLGQRLRQVTDDWSTQHYGAEKLLDLLDQRGDLFEVDEELDAEQRKVLRHWVRLAPDDDRAEPLPPPSLPASELPVPDVQPPPAEPPGSWQSLVADALQQSPEGEDGWLELSELEERLQQAGDGWSPQRYGADDLLDLLDRREDLFEIKEELDEAEREVLTHWIRLANYDGE